MNNDVSKYTQKLIDLGFQHERMIDLNNKRLQDGDLQYLRWKQTQGKTQLLIFRNKITHKGITILSKMKWQNMLKIDLELSWQQRHQDAHKSVTTQSNIYKCMNSITNAGIQHFFKAQWPDLQQFLLNGNFLSHQCLKYIYLANWKELRLINVYNCRIDESELVQVVLGYFPNVNEMDIQQNLIKSNRYLIIKKIFRQKFAQLRHFRSIFQYNPYLFYVKNSLKQVCLLKNYFDQPLQWLINKKRSQLPDLSVISVLPANKSINGQTQSTYLCMYSEDTGKLMVNFIKDSDPPVLIYDRKNDGRMNEDSLSLMFERLNKILQE